METNEKYMPITEASKVTGLSNAVIRRWCNADSIEHTTPGKRKYYVLVRSGSVVFKKKES